MANGKERKSGSGIDIDIDLTAPFDELVSKGGDANILGDLDPIAQGQRNLRDAGERSRSRAEKRAGKRR